MWSSGARLPEEACVLTGHLPDISCAEAAGAKGGAEGTAHLFNEFLWAGGIAALTQCYSTRGLEIVAGLNISNALCNLLNVVFVALGSAVGILIGQTLGASMYEKAKKMRSI